MSIEQALATLTAAIEANTAALSSGATKSATTSGSTGETKPATAAKTKPAASKPAAKADKPASTYTKSQMQAAVNEVKEALGTARAKQVIKDAGFDKLADVTEDKFDDLYLAAKALVEPEEATEEEDGL